MKSKILALSKNDEFKALVKANKISNKIVNNVRGINRVVYDISSNPPSTIELE